MKKLFIVSAITFLFVGNVCAQQGQRSEEERAQQRAEMIQRVAERTAKDFDLKGDAKESFMTTYKAYQNEMFQTNQGGMRQRPNEADEKKELTDEEANAKIQEQFTRQEEQIATMQKRLEIQKKYQAEFAKVLTPQQVLKVLTPQRNGQRGQGNGQRGQGDGQRGQGGFGGGRGGFGGGFGGPGGGFGGPGF
ncbi:MAG: hypothetical protein IKO73_01905 [Bacteroidaceae bacterium]|nr:hypothetical protein [Bacteroidaceae bacterium]